MPPTASSRSGAGRAVSIGLLTGLCACGPGLQIDDDWPIDAAPPPVDAVSNPQCRKMDLVFVVDDSPTMVEEQQSLAVNFPRFAEVLNDYTLADGSKLDYRAAITTTGVTASYYLLVPPDPPLGPRPQNGTDGKFRQTCGMTRPWLERTDPDLADTFACAAKVGTNGPAIEMPLYAAELALKETTNPGFVREDALLGIVVLTDEDDCSRRTSPFETHGDECAINGDTDVAPLQSFLAGFDALKGDRRRWATAVIAGPRLCDAVFVEADRLQQFVHDAGSNAFFGDICQGDLAPALQQALETFQIACENFPPIGRETSDGAQAEAADSRSALARIRLSR